MVYCFSTVDLDGEIYDSDVHNAVANKFQGCHYCAHMLGGKD